MEDFNYVIPLLSEEILESIKYKKLDIPYANQSKTQCLDIYFPEKATKPYPVIVHFHGGAFAFGSKRDENLESMLRGVDRGYAVVSVGYRKSGEAKWPALIYDAKAAIRFLRAHAEEYNFDPDKIAVWGPSAGGYIVSMLGVTNGNPVFEDLTMGNEQISSEVQAVVDWCGPCGGFLEMDEEIRANGIGSPDHSEPDSPESRIMGNAITKIPELVKLSTPYIQVGPKTPPFLIQHGEADPIVPVQQSIKLAEAIEAKLGKGTVILDTYKGQGHHGEPWYNELCMSTKVFDFLDQIFDK